MYLTKMIAPALALGVIASPAAAQYERSRTGRVADEIARGVRDTAQALGTVTDAIYEGVDGFRYRGQERFAISRCAPRVERYGRMRVEHVEPYGRRSWRVHGSTDAAGYAAGYGYGSRSSYGPRTFTCTVRDDGRVRLKTRRIRY